MSTLTTSLGDSAIMLRRNFKHTVRNPSAVFQAVLFPLVMMLMFVYVFGGAFKVPGRYIDYAVPGLIVMAITYGLGPTATAVNGDLTTGIINRFKAMDVSRGAVLTGHVVATTVRSLIADAAVIGVGFAMGFRPHAGFLDWLAAIGVMVLLGLGTSWLTVAMGLAAKTAESAGMATVPLIMLPFLSSAFVPADTMGTGVRQFAEYQPFTPIIETLRGLLTGTPSTGDTLAALAWCVGFGVLGYAWAIASFKKRA
ncbi:ABC transporter permease [Kitasatospora sp. NBC_01287]|uniref:ABC transporter permease n=1 Tax=Kitasatospora sp. NBC_01287 TaxID=2903573 RepID=UPI002252BC3E|nr:ABC transporter permease [Kitasatospora sp. NBC_01287]MCX4749738.1 ABC transporter permease [Kitasatospora sp. NBC_01287]